MSSPRSSQVSDINEVVSQCQEATDKPLHEVNASTGPCRKASFGHKVYQKIANWESSITFWILLCTVVFVFNLVAIVTVTVKYGFNLGLSIVYRGNCDWVQSASTGLHFLGNFLSTLLMAGSNFCMQFLSAPTRLEVDRAHARGVALDIGIPSVRNFKYMKRLKLALWLALGVSSLPLHLFYNSAIYYSIKYFRPDIIIGTEAILRPGPYKAPLDPEDPNNSVSADSISSTHNAITNGSLQRMEPEDCIRAYGQTFITDRSTVVLVPKAETATVSANVSGGASLVPNTVPQNCDPRSTAEWVCGNIKPETCEKKPCRFMLNEVVQQANDWRPRGFTVDHCLSQTESPDCQLLIVLPFAIIVLIINFIKIILMTVVLKYCDKDPFLTIGDALQSFLKRQDPWTRGNCLYGRSDFTRKEFVWRCDPKIWHGKRMRFLGFPGWWKRLFGLIPWLTALITAFVFFILGRQQPRMDVSILNLLQLGLGNPQPQTRLDALSPSLMGASYNLERTITRYTSIANSPQLVFSLAYFTFNKLLTEVFTEREWSHLPLNRKGLRVSKLPQGHQRHTHFLQLPYRYSISLLSFSGVIHWLLSQSFYVVALQLNELGQQQNPYLSRFSESWRRLPNEIVYYHTLGWSPLALLLVIVLGAIMVLGAGILYWRPLPTAMPHGATSSLVLAAACHPDWETEKEGIEYRELTWGVSSHSFGGDDCIGHCSLSSQPLSCPEAGRKYA